MLPRILTQKCINRGLIQEEEREIYEYGFDVTIYTIWSTAVLFLIGLVLRQFPASLIIVLGFYVFQSTGGGYHARTHLKCLLTMVAGLLVGLSFVFIKEHHIVLWTILGVGAYLLLLFPLVLHPNKAYLETERKRLTIRSLIVTLSMEALAIIINVFWKKPKKPDWVSWHGFPKGTAFLLAHDFA